MGRKAFAPTEAQTLTVKLHAIAGTPHEIICKVITNPETGQPITLPTLYKYFRDALDVGLAEINAKAVGVLIRRLNNNDLGAACFVLKTRAGWSEKQQSYPLDEEKLAAMIESKRAEREALV